MQKNYSFGYFNTRTIYLPGWLLNFVSFGRDAGRDLPGANFVNYSVFAFKFVIFWLFIYAGSFKKYQIGSYSGSSHRFIFNFKSCCSCLSQFGRRTTKVLVPVVKPKEKKRIKKKKEESVLFKSFMVGKRCNISQFVIFFLTNSTCDKSDLVHVKANG